MTMAEPGKNIFVYENWTNEDPVIIGVLHIDNSRVQEICSFSYDEGYLKNNKSCFIDPELNFYAGRQYAAGKVNVISAVESLI